MKRLFALVAVSMVTACTSLFAGPPSKASIVRLDAALNALVPPGTKLELLKDGFQDGLEGGVWIRKGAFLLFSNKPKQEIDKWNPQDRTLSVYLNLADAAKDAKPSESLSSGITLDQQGRLVYCSPGERTIIRIERDGKRTIVAERFNGKRLVHPNDLVYKSDGTLYFTDNGDAPADEKDALPRSVYMLKNGQIDLLSTGVLQHPNGIAISPDEKFLYVNDSGKKQVWRFVIQSDDHVGNGEVWVDMSSDSAPGIPDGMRVDKEGDVYDAGPGGVWILSPEGKHLGTFLLSPDRATNMAFGGPDGKTLYLVNHTTLYQVRLNVEGVRP